MLGGLILLLGCAIVSPVLVHADPVPGVHIETPSDGTVTNASQITVRVAFAAFVDPEDGSIGNVKVIDLLMDGVLVATRLNQPERTQGTVEFQADLTPLADGSHTLTAVAYQANPRAGHTASHRIGFVIDRVPLQVTIIGPDDGLATTLASIDVTGSVNKPAVVKVNDAPVPLAGLSFSTTIPLREGNNFIAVTATDAPGNFIVRSATVIRDTSPPRVSILTPAEGTFVGPTVTVAGVVTDVKIGTINRSDCTVLVNGVEAEVANRSFVARGVPVPAGRTRIRAIATDGAGNTGTSAVPVVGDASPVSRILAASGDGQSAVVRSAPAAGLVARAVDNSGGPIAGVPIEFRVTRGDGTLSGGLRVATIVSDAAGESSIGLTLGSTAGAATNIVEAGAPGFFGRAVFVTEALPDPAGARSLIAVGGANQIGRTGGVATRPLAVLLTDRHGNPLSDEMVTFSMESEAGLVDGVRVAQATTDAGGRAFAVLSLGGTPGPNTVSARADAAGAAAVFFSASTLTPGDPSLTALRGVVLDNRNAPIPDDVELSIPGGTSVLADSQGRFRLTPVPAGHIHLNVTPQTLPFTPLGFELDLVPGAENDMDRPIYLADVDADGSVQANPDFDVTIERADYPGFRMVVPAGSASFPGGGTTGEVQVLVVNSNAIPMAPPEGSAPRRPIAIKPADALFDPPAPFRFPNQDGLEPGRVLPMYSFNHDVFEFVAVSTAHVTEDGAFIVSDPGQGFIHGGWHIVPTPVSAPTCVNNHWKIARYDCNEANVLGSACAKQDSCPLSICQQSTAASPDNGCWCPQTPPSQWNNNPTPPPIFPKAGMQCTRGDDPIYGFTGEEGCCRTSASVTGLVCCPNGHYCTGSTIPANNGECLVVCDGTTCPGGTCN